MIPGMLQNQLYLFLVRRGTDEPEGSFSYGLQPAVPRVYAEGVVHDGVRRLRASASRTARSSSNRRCCAPTPLEVLLFLLRRNCCCCC